MWTYFYKSKDRLIDIASQINPNLKAEFTAFIEDEGRIDTEIEGKTSNLLSNLFNFSGKAILGKKKNKKTEIKGIISQDVFINSLEKYFPKNKYTILNKDTKVAELNDMRKLIRIGGTFKINVEGENHFDRIAKFQNMDYIEWTSCFKNINVSFLTSKQSYTSARPSLVIQALANKSKRIEIDGFGTFLRHKDKSVEISPLFLGSYFDL